MAGLALKTQYWKITQALKYSFLWYFF